MPELPFLQVWQSMLMTAPLVGAAAAVCLGMQVQSRCHCLWCVGTGRLVTG
jgi:hypothetical protein